MAQYVLIFKAKISWEGRMNGLPEELQAFLLFDDEGASQQQFDHVIRVALDAQFQEFAKVQGMYVQRDQGQILDLRKTPQDRMFVPFRWIVYIAPYLTKMTGELSETTEEGAEILKDGSVPVKN